MPGPLSPTVTRKRVAWLGGGGAVPLLDATSSLTTTSGRMPASSEASRALSTASLTQVRSALRGLSKPRRWRFLVKNSETEISRWRAPISTADTAGFGGEGEGLAGAALDSGTGFAISLFDSRPGAAPRAFSTHRRRRPLAGAALQPEPRSARRRDWSEGRHPEPSRLRLRLAR